MRHHREGYRPASKLGREGAGGGPTRGRAGPPAPPVAAILVELYPEGASIDVLTGADRELIGEIMRGAALALLDAADEVGQPD